MPSLRQSVATRMRWSLPVELGYALLPLLIIDLAGDGARVDFFLIHRTTISPDSSPSE